jgi:hypothetical protein
MSIHRKNDMYKRSSVADVVNPTNGLRGEMMRHGVKPRDHMKENFRNLKAAQRKNIEDKEDAARPQKELYKLSQFKDAQSRVYDETDASPRRGSEDREFLARGASEKRREDQAYAGKLARREVDRKLREAADLAAQPPSPRKASLHRDIAPTALKTNENFINRNKGNAMVMRAPEAQQREDEGAHHREYGRVPAYLEQRNAEWQEEANERRRRAPDPSAPPGMCAMPEAERLATLETLESSRKECMYQLERMPFNIETISMKKKQEGLETKMREIENAIGIFSKPKVYVAMGR